MRTVPTAGGAVPRVCVLSWTRQRTTCEAETATRQKEQNMTTSTTNQQTDTQVEAAVLQAEDLACSIQIFVELAAQLSPADPSKKGAILLTALGLVVSTLFRTHLANGGSRQAVTVWLATVGDAIDDPVGGSRVPPHTH